jgi:hypothetical protein
MDKDEKIITDAAAIAAELICSSNGEIAAEPFGANVESLKNLPA